MLSLFHPLVARWFSEHVGKPTDIQELAWPRIAAGEHVLAVAPTGSGKTLTAFLSALNSLATGAWPTGRVSVVYVSPLKALGTDVRANLLTPLAGLRRAFAAAGEDFPALRAEIRSGDTPSEDRRRMLRQPPEILITTPESLNLLLSSQGGRGMLTAVRLVILDEIHAVAGSKRGCSCFRPWSGWPVWPGSSSGWPCRPQSLPWKPWRPWSAALSPRATCPIRS